VRAEQRRLRVLYSFPHKIGADRICYTAWQQVNGLAAAGADVLVFPGVVHQPLPANVKVQLTLARGRLRIPYKILGRMRALALHDYIVSRRLRKLVGQVDIIHTWPLAALRTLKTAKELGIPTVLERPNTHTQFAYEAVKRECERLGIAMPPGHEHAYNSDVLAKESAEYLLATRLLCPSDFVARTFMERGFSEEKIARHQYGFDDKIYHPNGQGRKNNPGLSMLFVGGCAPRKGLHYALEAWLKSPAHADGTFRIAGEFIPGYAEKLASMLSHPSISVLGHRKDVPELMRQSDILVLPTIEEGSALVTSEARGCGCVLLVSEAAGAICRHMENALVHSVGDVNTLAQHLTVLYKNRPLLKNLRSASLMTTHEITWRNAGLKLLGVYSKVIREHRHCHQG
jgi:glycosyltransferase involved in cell wall biosynthesis